MGRQQIENLFVVCGVLFILAIAKAQNIIDLELEKVGIELFDSNLPTYVYNCEAGPVTLRWCLLKDNYEL
ncbi:MAG: hypothetical protein WBA13_07670 [Microcoleaceae cyanobacterium]